MYIKQITSYGDAWRILNEDHPEIISDIVSAISLLSIPIKNDSLGSPEDTYQHARIVQESTFSNSLEDSGWSMMTNRNSRIANVPVSIRGLGHIKSGIAVRYHRHREVFNRWLYTITPIATKNNVITIPIAVMYASYGDIPHRASPMSSLSSDRITDELKALEPLSYSNPFLILGLSHSQELTSIDELASNISLLSKDVIINRSLEFPPEYHQAGLGILNYFGTVLRDKYPNTKARVRIEQEGLCVRLIIESENGDKEIIEKALEEYESVVRGDTLPEAFLDDKLKIIELKQELRIAEIRIDHQKEMIQFHRDHALSLTQLIGHSLSQPQRPITIDVNPIISVSSSSCNNVDIPLGEIFENLSTLSSLSASNPEMQLRLLDLEKALSELEKTSSPTEIKDSSGLKKLKNFIDDASKAGTAANNFLKAIEGGVDAAQNLASKYNGLASWCGLPQVPKFFLATEQ